MIHTNQFIIRLAQQNKNDLRPGVIHASFMILPRDYHPYIHLLSEMTLAPDQVRIERCNKDIHLVILPLLGDIIFESGARAFEIQVGASYSLDLNQNDAYSIKNLNRENACHFLILELPTHSGSPLKKVEFASEKWQNEFTHLASSSHDRILIGRFAARFEMKLQVNNFASVYIIDGIAEISGRLLSKGDALEIFGSEILELEALTKNSIILVIESQVQKIR